MTETLSCSATCKNCMKSGLAILPVRYTVVPTSMPSLFPDGMAGPGALDVKLSAHRHSLRTLRDGWLYLYYEQGARGKRYWEVYKSTEDGRLWRQSLPLPPEPMTDPKCAQRGGAVPMDVITIERPEKATKVWIAFSEYAWHDDTIKLYASDAALRTKRMQMINPSSWITSGSGNFGGGIGEYGHAVVATPEAVEKIVEYHPSLDIYKLMPPASPLTKPSSWRVDDGSLWSQQATRYTLHPRQAGTTSASNELVDMMAGIGETAEGTPHKPMILGLWDGVGTAHELNGFHNDAASMMLRYSSEQLKRVDAAQMLDAAELSIRSGAARSESTWQQAKMSAMLSGGEGMALMMPDTQQMIADAGKLTPAQAQSAGDSAWADYTSYLKGKTWPNDFRQYFDSMNDEAYHLQERRVVDVKTWLENPTFQHTLNDYCPSDAGDGWAFEGVINEAFGGLPSTDLGQTIIDQYIRNTDPTDEKSYFWRAFCYNQTDIKQEVKAVLQEGKSKESESILNRTEAWYESKQADIATSLTYLKSFAKFYNQMEEVHKHERAVSSTEAGLRNIKFDRLILWSGRNLVKFLGPVSMTLAGPLFKGMLLERGGLSSSDAKGIAGRLAQYEGTMQAKLDAFEAENLKAGMEAKLARAKAYQSLADDSKGSLLRGLYANAKLTDGAARTKTEAATKIASVLLIIELLNFSAMASKSNKTTADKWALVGGGLSLIGAALSVPNKYLGGFGKTAAKETLANIKVASSVLGALSSMISLVTDAGKATEGGRKKSMSQAVFYGVKALLDFASITSSVLTAVSSSAPLLARSANLSEGSIRFLGKLTASIAGAQERVEARAAGVSAKEASARISNAAWKATKSVTGRTVATEIAGELTAESALLITGRVILICTGWEVALVVTVLTLLYNYFTPDALEDWIAHSIFGKSAHTEWTAEKQRDEYKKAMAETGNMIEQ
ncbi:T6SS effector BTH_I2691 family protein [Robbsia andropogonis]|uniref:T6SS effector BTH_I2691 family protein n=1 Tax=Robbsia andropogonis TaxID=28092 RepID=UPI00209F1E7B|nr:T6SS effector BTH_I2691 family protein [Robbsia andropogonis]MCP1121428.1 hypothetical protein [Robbsia andropogonis]MCP1131224.1 hypothetical protein [Robbsia andropogonis]